MGRHTSIYKLNKQAAREFLYDDLISDTKFEKSFSTYIDERRAEFTRDYKISAGSIFQTILIDFNKIVPDEIFEIVMWYEEVLKEKFGWQQQQYIDKTGIELLLEIPTTTWCYSFMFQFGHFSDFFELQDYYNSEGGFNLEVTYFIHFLDYVILLMHRINDEKISPDDVFDYTAEQEKSLEDIITSRKDDNQIQQAIDDELRILKIYWNEYIADREKNRRSPEAHTILLSWYFFEECLRMKEVLLADQQSTNIVITDS